jgi:hypothetical protein
MRALSRQTVSRNGSIAWCGVRPPNFIDFGRARFTPARLVVDPEANYFWLPCRPAAANGLGRRAVPLVTQQLVRSLARTRARLRTGATRASRVNPFLTAVWQDFSKARLGTVRGLPPGSQGRG